MFVIIYNLNSYRQILKTAYFFIYTFQCIFSVNLSLYIFSEYVYFQWTSYSQISSFWLYLLTQIFLLYISIWTVITSSRVSDRRQVSELCVVYSSCCIHALFIHSGHHGWWLAQNNYCCVCACEHMNDRKWILSNEHLTNVIIILGSDQEIQSVQKTLLTKNIHQRIYVTEKNVHVTLDIHKWINLEVCISNIIS